MNIDEIKKWRQVAFPAQLNANSQLDIRHRIDGPAVSYFNKKHNINIEVYRVNGGTYHPIYDEVVYVDF